MTDHPDYLAWVAAIRAKPDDDVTRLAFADWCEKRGEDARAWLIRYQIEKGLRYEYPPGTAAEVICLWDGFVQMKLTIAPAIPDVAYTTSRGFIESVTCPAAAWVEHGDAVLRCQPVTRVRLTTELDHLPESVDFSGPPGTVIDFGLLFAGQTLRFDGPFTRTDVLARRWPGVAFEMPPPEPQVIVGLPEMRDRIARVLRESGWDAFQGDR